MNRSAAAPGALGAFPARCRRRRARLWRDRRRGVRAGGACADRGRDAGRGRAEDSSRGELRGAGPRAAVRRMAQRHHLRDGGAQDAVRAFRRADRRHRGSTGTLWGEPVDVARHAPGLRAEGRDLHGAARLPRTPTASGRRPASWTCKGERRWTLLVSPVSMRRPGASSRMARCACRRSSMPTRS